MNLAPSDQMGHHRVDQHMFEAAVMELSVKAYQFKILIENFRECIVGHDSNELTCRILESRWDRIAREFEDLRKAGDKVLSLEGDEEEQRGELLFCDHCSRTLPKSDFPGVYDLPLCKDCTVEAWEHENPEPVLYEPVDPEEIAPHMARVEKWANLRRAFQDSIGVTR